MKKSQRNNLKLAFNILGIELITFGISLMVAIILEIPENIKIDRFAVFLAMEMYWHAALGIQEIRRMKKPPIAEGEL